MSLKAVIFYLMFFAEDSQSYSGQPSGFVIRNIKVALSANVTESRDYDRKAFSEAFSVMKKSGLFAKLAKPGFAVCKKSVDARKKDRLFFVYSVIASFPEMNHEYTPQFLEQCEKCGFSPVYTAKENLPYDFDGKNLLRPVIVGFGPCGMFLALMLARAGLCPIVLERGEDVDKREKSVERYWKDGVLNSESNVQFGEGGAGTFSDGKLLTRINDPLCTFVLETFHRHGADADILVNAKPHIGTDKLRGIVKSIRREITELGGEVLFETKFEGCTFNADGSKAFVCIDGKSESVCTDALFLCLGHSARDTFCTLAKSGVKLEPKPFSVGVRIEHLQQNIDKSLYGNFAGHPAVPKGEYALSMREGERAVYTFCMCPGGTVVASASENGSIVTNGMSYYARDGKNANSAVAVSVSTNDLENPCDPFSAIDFQHKIEKAAFELCGSDGSAPIMTLGDFYADGRKSSSIVLPTYTGKTVNRDIKSVFPGFVNDMLAKGFCAFDKKISGFSDGGALITAPETRTSSPVRIPRNDARTSVDFPCLYPCGEGAGYAGGITSAAVDGIKSALAYMEKLTQML